MCIHILFTPKIKRSQVQVEHYNPSVKHPIECPVVTPNKQAPNGTIDKRLVSEVTL